MTAVLLALGAAVGWGTSDFLGGIKSRAVPLLSVLLVSQVCGLAILSAFTVARASAPPEAGSLGYAVIAGVGEVVAIASLYRGLAVGTMSIVAPVASLAPVVPLLAGALTGSLPTAVQFVGVAMALLGLAVCAYRPSERSGTSSPASSIVYGLLAAAGFGVYFLAIGAASETDVGWALVTARAASVAVIAAVTIVLRHKVAMSRRNLAGVALIGILMVAADALYAVSTTFGLIGIVAILGSLHTVVTIVLARIVLRERLRRPQKVGIVLTLLGVLSISAGMPHA